MLAPDQRLRRSDDFATVIRRGRRAARNGLVVHLHAPDSTEPVARRPRAGFVVPRAVGKAVTRNAVRRRLRHLLRTELDRLTPGTDVVVRVLPEAAGRSFEELGRHLREALAAAGRPRPAGRREGG